MKYTAQLTRRLKQKHTYTHTILNTSAQKVILISSQHSNKLNVSQFIFAMLFTSVVYLCELQIRFSIKYSKQKIHNTFEFQCNKALCQHCMCMSQLFSAFSQLHYRSFFRFSVCTLSWFVNLSNAKSLTCDEVILQSKH